MFLDAGPRQTRSLALAHAFEPCLEETRGDDRDDEQNAAAAAAAASTVSKKREAIRFLQTAVTRQGALARDVHDLLVRFLVDAHRHSPAALTRYLVGAGRSGGGEPMYDRERAARLCEPQARRTRRFRFESTRVNSTARYDSRSTPGTSTPRFASRTRARRLDADPNDSEGGPRARTTTTFRRFVF